MGTPSGKPSLPVRWTLASTLLLVAGQATSLPATGGRLGQEPHETALVSRAAGADGVKGDDDSARPSVSADGRYVAFESFATNLHPDDAEIGLDVFVRDTVAHETVLVSRAAGSEGVNGNSFSHSPSISADGRYVAFESFATNLHPDDVDNALDVFVRDLETHETLLVSRASGAAGTAGNVHSNDPSISADGRYVAFESQATNLHPDDTDLVRDVFVRDLLTHETFLVSRAAGADGVKGDTASLNPAVSGDGRYVAFDSGADNLHPDVNDGFQHVFVRDLQTHDTTLASRADGADGATGSGGSERPSITVDGRYVAFESLAINLHPDDADGVRDTFVRDLQTHQTHLASRASGAGGSKGDGDSSEPAISADGRFVTFGSSATNLHPDDLDPGLDAYVRDLQAQETFLVSRASGAFGVKGDDDSSAPSISADGSFVAFASAATNLHPDDPDAIHDVFVRGVLAPPRLVPIGLEVDYTPLVSRAASFLPHGTLDSDGNGVFEPGEGVQVAPAWGNDGPLSQTLFGIASELNGPAGPVYTLVLDEADYGVLSPGAIASCRDSGLCYQIEVDPLVGDRPAPHWDATFDETLSDGEATTHGWTLHVGDSFADVQVSSPFYRFVETLLHHGVTGGCTATEYCPAAPNTRAQMPVFVLRAAEAPGYQPPPCTPGSEVFADLTAASPFCPWIEELFDRGVVVGCGGGKYCPSQPVTRAQMAVFLLRTLEGDGYAPPGCSGVFEDVPCPSPFADWIEELAARQITSGCVTAPMRYCPAEPVTRQQMAVFISRTFGLTLYGP